VAKYAQACNLFPGPDLAHKLDVLRAHCEREGRDYDEITKTAYFLFDPGEDGKNVGAILAELERLASLGVQEAIGGVIDAQKIRPLEILGSQVIPQVADL
jgi:hypothetical protein